MLETTITTTTSEKSCLKISYQGDESFIICDTNSNYKEIMAHAADRFDIPEIQRSALVLTNGHGYVFEHHLLEYFLMLFPSPEITFYMRFDFNRLRRILTSSTSVCKRRSHDGAREEESQEKEEDQQQATNSHSFAAAPVRRQNCFLGLMPRQTIKRSLRERQIQSQELTSSSLSSTSTSLAKRPRLVLHRHRLQPLTDNSNSSSNNNNNNNNRSIRI